MTTLTFGNVDKAFAYFQKMNVLMEPPKGVREVPAPRRYRHSVALQATELQAVDFRPVPMSAADVWAHAVWMFLSMLADLFEQGIALQDEVSRRHTQTLVSYIMGKPVRLPARMSAGAFISLVGHCQVVYMFEEKDSAPQRMRFIDSYRKLRKFSRDYEAELAAQELRRATEERKQLKKAKTPLH